MIPKSTPAVAEVLAKNKSTPFQSIQHPSALKNDADASFHLTYIGILIMQRNPTKGAFWLSGQASRGKERGGPATRSYVGWRKGTHHRTMSLTLRPNQDGHEERFEGAMLDVLMQVAGSAKMRIDILH